MELLEIKLFDHLTVYIKICLQIPYIEYTRIIK